MARPATDPFLPPSEFPVPSSCSPAAFRRRCFSPLRLVYLSILVSLCVLLLLSTRLSAKAVAVVQRTSTRLRPGLGDGSVLGSAPAEVVSADVDGLVDAAGNATLGFGEVMYISMPYRTDRQDGMNLLASYTGVKLTLVPGVDGDAIHEKAKPHSDLRPPELGCWRSHVNAWTRLLESNLETALIIEDDIDWDVNIRSIMRSFSAELRHNNTLRPSALSAHELETAPYGLDWDMLEFGYCLHSPNPERPDLVHAYHDPNAPRKSQTSGTWMPQMESVMEREGGGVEEDYQTRLLMPLYSPVCTMGYALTRRGAARLVYHLGYRELTTQVDLAIAGILQEGLVKGYLMMPPPITPWRVGGSQDSDISPSGHTEESRGNDGGRSDSMRNSGRLAMAEEFRHTNHWEMLEAEKPRQDVDAS